MAIPNLRLIEALRKTAKKLQQGAPYQWGNMGGCNCGHLAQEITRKTRAEIHAYALQARMGDWAEQTSEFCPTSNLPMDLVISEMLEVGLTIDDLQHLERLSDKTILQRLPLGQHHLRHNVRDDVVKYLEIWATSLEEQLLEEIPLEKMKSVLNKPSLIV